MNKFRYLALLPLILEANNGEKFCAGALRNAAHAIEGRMSKGTDPKVTIKSQSEFNLEDLFHQTFPDSDLLGVARKRGFSAPSEFLAVAIFNHTISPNEGRFSPSYFREGTPKADDLKMATAIEKIFAAHDNQAPEAKKYFTELGRWLASKIEIERSKKNQELPPPPDVPGQYWDMASGRLLEDQFKFMDQRRKYHFFDTSPLVNGYLSGLAERFGIDAEASQLDVREIPQPSEPIAVIRTKNAHTYAKGFEKRLETMASWITPGGQLIIQSEYPFMSLTSFNSMIKHHGPLIQSLIQKGWRFQFDLKEKFQFDTVILTRPLKEAKPLTAEEADKIWNNFVTLGQAKRDH